MSITIEQSQLDYVLDAYQCSNDNSQLSPLGNGLINCTYLVSSPEQKFVLQRINHHVFKKPAEVIENADLVNAHLQEKKEVGSYTLEPIWQVKDKNDSTLVQFDENYWRAIQFIPNCYTVEEVETVTQAKQVARAFGQFTATLSDFPAKRLNEIIKDFHNLDHRLSQLKDAIDKNPKSRLADCKDLVDACLNEVEFINQVAELADILPIQVTHNDTKINNLLFSKDTMQPIAVIDLDTCMPGFIMHDFGDMVRTCCSNLPEDGKNIEDMTVRLDIFKGLAQGYIESFGTNITITEKESLIVGAQLLPFMIGIRFLTDFIDGDNYFHTKYDDHNLVRAKNQIRLFQLLKEKRKELANYVMNG